MIVHLISPVIQVDVKVLANKALVSRIELLEVRNTRLQSEL